MGRLGCLTEIMAAFDEAYASMGASFMELGRKELSDGRIAVLGGNGDAAGNGYLIDIFCGIYSPETGVMQQVYLFAGDGTARESRENEAAEILDPLVSLMAMESQ